MRALQLWTRLALVEDFLRAPLPKSLPDRGVLTLELTRRLRALAALHEELDTTRRRLLREHAVTSERDPGFADFSADWQALLDSELPLALPPLEYSALGEALDAVPPAVLAALFDVEVLQEPEPGS